MIKKAIVLLSGGLDSATCLAMALKEMPCVALTIDYGQTHKVEVKRAAALAKHFKVEHIIRKMEFFAVSALEGGDGVDSRFPSTYLPGRNAMFLSMALCLACARQGTHIYIGANIVDYSGYPDCRPRFMKAFQLMADEAIARKVHIKTPLMHLSKEGILRMAIQLGVPIDVTLSCYFPKDGKPCGVCDSCKIRKKAEDMVVPATVVPATVVPATAEVLI